MPNEFDSDVSTVDSEIIPMSDDEFTALMTGKGIQGPPAPPPAAQPGTPPAAKPAVPVPGGQPQPESPKGKSIFPVPPSDGKTDIEEVEDIKNLFSKEEVETPAGEPPAAGEPPKQEPPAAGEPQEDNFDAAVLRSTAQYLMSKGLWQEVEDFENLELTPETYAEIAERQAEAYAEDTLEEALQRAGKYRKIVEHAMDGGNPDAIFNLFREEKRVEDIDPKTPQGAEHLIRAYYTNVVGWEDAEVAEFIEKARGEKTLEQHGIFSKKKYQEQINKQIKLEDQAKEQSKQAAVAKRQQYEQGVIQAVNKLNLDQKSSQTVADFILKPSVKIPETGKVLTGYQERMLQIQANPDEFMELVHYILDKPGYLAAKLTVANSKDAEIKFGKTVSGNKARPAAAAAGLVERDSSRVNNESLPNWAINLKPKASK